MIDQLMAAPSAAVAVVAVVAVAVNGLGNVYDHLDNHFGHLNYPAAAIESTSYHAGLYQLQLGINPMTQLSISPPPFHPHSSGRFPNPSFDSFGAPR